MDILNEVCLRLGHFYLAGQVLRDSGFYLYAPKTYAEYFFTRLGFPVPEDPR